MNENKECLENSENFNEGIKPPKVKKHSSVSGIIIPIVVSIVVFILLHSVFMFAYVPTESMDPTLKAGHFFIGLRVYNNYKVGDVAVFKQDDVFLVKRIAGVGGDEFTHEGVNYKVPEGHYFMLGDNKENSYDSRYWENPYISEEDLVAVVVLPNTKIKK